MKTIQYKAGVSERKYLLFLLLCFPVFQLCAQSVTARPTIGGATIGGPTMSEPTMGLLQKSAGLSEGYVLFSNNEHTYLIDTCGLVVNEWISDHKPGKSVYLLEDGSLLRSTDLAPTVQNGFDAGGRGGGFERFNWEGELEWSYEYLSEHFHPHHDIEPLPNGNFLTLVWDLIPETEATAVGRIYSGEIWSERIVEFQPIGNGAVEIVWEWRLWDHLIQNVDPSMPNFAVPSESPERLDINYLGTAAPETPNWVHLNAIAYNPELDQIAVSSRMLSEVWIIDHSTTTAEAAGSSGGVYGKGGDFLYRFGDPRSYGRGTASDKHLNQQHDIRWIPAGQPFEGHLMVFNNREAEGASAVKIWMPPVDSNRNYTLPEGEAYGPDTMSAVIDEPGFYSSLTSGAHMLPNGNLFICEGGDGRLLEIREGEIVWEYINPVNQNGHPGLQGGSPRFNQLFRAEKYPANYPGFADKTLTAGIPVELNPLNSDCYTPRPDAATLGPESIQLLNNPFGETLYLYFDEKEPVEEVSLNVYTSAGKKIYSTTLVSGTNSIGIDGKPGLYLLQFIGAQSEFVLSQKAVKSN